MKETKNMEISKIRNIPAVLFHALSGRSQTAAAFRQAAAAPKNRLINNFPRRLAGQYRSRRPFAMG